MPTKGRSPSPSVGTRTGPGPDGMQQIFTFERTVVRHWFEVDLDDASMEHGCRVELSELAPRAHRGTESAAQVVTVDRPLWRVDLFDRLGAAPGSYDAAHYHPYFDGVEPSPRVWDADLTAQPWEWLGAQLRTAALLPSDPQDGATLAQQADDVVTAGRVFAPDRCGSVERCYELTKDTRESVRLMVENLKAPEQLDRQRVARWLPS